MNEPFENSTHNGVKGDPLVRIRGLSKRFGATVAIDDVSIDFHAGEVHCLLGENGAGKSTVGKILAGLFPPDRGQILLNGKVTTIRSIAEARSHGIAMVFQELSLAPDLTARQNICLGTERRPVLGLIDTAQETKLCCDLCKKYSIDINIEERIGTLPVAQQQMVEILKALSRDASVLIFDEPTAMLGIHEKKALFEIIRQARREGKAIVFVTHHVDEVVELADRISLLKDGRLLETFPATDDVDPDFIIEKLSGSSRMQEIKRHVERGKPVLEVRGLEATGVPEQTLQVHEGEIVGLYGIVGCGREELVQALVGLRRPKAASALLNGEPFSAGDPAAARKKGVVYLPSGRAANAVFPSRSIRENFSISTLQNVARLGVVSGQREVATVKERLHQFATKFRHHDDSISSLSGGNQQKVILARTLEGGARLAILEDPTAGVDVETKRNIHGMLLKQSEKYGLATLLISSDLQETIAICDTIYIMYQGKIVSRVVAPVKADESKIISAVIGATSQDNLSNQEKSRPHEAQS